MLVETIAVSYRPPFEPGLRTVIEPGLCPRHDEQAEDKGQHDDQPGKFSEPVTDLSPPGQMTHLVERVAQAVGSEVGSLQDTDRITDACRS